MFCKFCGKEIQNDSSFCNYCGKTVGASRKELNCKKFIPYILGAVFIILGSLPFFINADVSVINNTYRFFDAKEISAFVSLNSFLNSFSSFFTFSSCFLSIYLGLLLILKEKRIKASAIMCLVMHGLSVLYHIFTNVCVRLFPGWVVSLFTDNQSVIDAGVDLVESVPNLFSFSEFSIIFEATLSVITIGLLVFLLYNLKAKETITRNNSTIGIPLMLISSALSLRVLSFVNSSKILWFGYDHISGYSFACSAFNKFLSQYLIIILFGILISSIIFAKSKNKLQYIIPSAVILLSFLLSFLLPAPVAMGFNTPPEFCEYTITYLRLLIIESSITLLLALLWFNSIMKQNKPLWLQISIPAVMPVIFFTDILISNRLEIHTFPFGLTIVSVIFIISLFIKKKPSI